MPKSLSPNEEKIYNAVATRYLIQFMDEFLYDSISFEIDLKDKIKLKNSENIEVQKGWRNLYDPSNLFGFTYKIQRDIPDMKEGDEVQIASIDISEDYTTPPKRFKEYQILKTMENISLYYDDVKLEKGIGTPATRAAILSELFKNKYLINKKGEIYPSEKTINLIEMLPDDMSSPKLRADMEAKLNLIIEQKLSKKEYQKEVSELIKKQYKEIKEISQKLNKKVIDKDEAKPSEKQLEFAKKISVELGIEIPEETLKYKTKLTKWIKTNEKKRKINLSDKQRNFAEYYCEDKDILAILEADKNGVLTKDQMNKFRKWIKEYMQTSEYRKKRAKKAAETRKKNNEKKAKRSKS